MRAKPRSNGRAGLCPLLVSAVFILALAPGTARALATLNITETVVPDIAVGNCPFKYVITVTNTDAVDTATSVQFIDTIPVDAVFLSATNSNGAPPTTDLSFPDMNTYVIADINDLSPGESAVVEIFVRPTNSHGTQYAWVSYNNGGGMTYSQGPSTTVAWRRPYARITGIAVDKAEYRSGESVVFRIDYANTGEDSAWAFKLWDTLPAGSTFLGAEPVVSMTLTGNMVTWDFGMLGPGATGSATLYSIAPVVCACDCAVPLIRCPTYEVTGYYANSCGLANSTPVFTWACLNLFNGGLALTKTVSGVTVPQGGTLTYFISGTNPCLDTILNVTVWDSLPPGTTFISATGSGTLFNGSMVAWGEALMNPWYQPANSYFSRSVTVRVDSPGPILGPNIAYGDFVNTAGFVQPRAASGPQGVTVLNPVLALTMSGPATASGGDTITYTLKVRNTGTDTAFGVEIVDSLPAYFYAVSPVATGTVVVWVIGQLDIGAEATVTLQMKSVRNDSTAILFNRAHASCINSNLIVQAPAPDVEAITLSVSLQEPRVYPSPFNPSKASGGTLKFSELSSGSVVTILTVSGKRIRTLKGVVRSRLEWDGKNEGGKDVAPGLYLYIIETYGANGDKKTVKGRFGLAR